MKFIIGQQVCFAQYDHWSACEYDIKATVVGFCDYHLNNVPVYKLKAIGNNVIYNIAEKYLKEV